MNTHDLTIKACNSLSRKLDKKITSRIIKNPINNLLAGFEEGKVLWIFRKPVFIISQDAKSGKDIIYSLRKEYDKAVNNLASELELEYSNEHYFRGALIT
jgi:hypothetical protein